MYKYLLLICLIFFSCQENRAIKLKKIDTVYSRKVYHDLSDSIVALIRDDYPEMSNSYLEKSGLIQKGKLQLNKFKYENIILTNGSDVIYAKYLKNEQDGAIRMLFKRGTESKKILIMSKDDISPILTCKADIIPGGYEEIIMLDKNYTLNGDTFEVSIYEIY